MQKLLSLLLGVAVTMNLSTPNEAFAQAFNLGSNAKSKTLKASIHLDHKLSRVNGNEGAMTVQVQGGTKPYQYQWSTGSSAHFVNGLGAGAYSVTVTDATGLRVIAGEEVDGFDCATASCEFRTQTQGGWGAVPNGNNPGVYLHANFAGAFPNGLVVGCDHTLTLTSAQAVTNFLPSGSVPSALTGDLTDPGGNYSNVLAGQVVALTLNVGFDNYDANFGTSSASLGGLVIANGDFAGMTVQQLLDEANAFLGGCPSIYTASQLNDAAAAINENFDNGTQNHGYLECPEESDLEVTVNTTGETCVDLCNGSAEAVVSGGNLPYSYLWSNGATTDHIHALCPDNYSVSVTDALGCLAFADAEVDSSENVLLASIVKTDITCNGDGDGSITITIDEGTGPFVYTWNPAISNSESANWLAAGVYMIHIEDANGCGTDVQEEILEPTELLAASAGIDASCLANDGSASVNAEGGTEPYSYLWSNGETTAAIQNLSAGSYTVVVTDANGCTAQDNVNIQAGAIVLQISGQDATCPEVLDGSASVVASGGTEPYSYLWSPAGGTNASASGLGAGVYTVTVTDFAGCVAVVDVEIGNVFEICNTRFASAGQVIENLKVYPSVITSEVKVVSSASDAINATITINSLEGKIAYSNVISLQPQVETSVCTSEFAPGIYSMNIITEHQNQVFRIVKK